MDKDIMKINERGFWENETAEGHGHDAGLAEALKEFFIERNAQSVLDVGCGDGYYTNYLHANGILTIGVDGNPNTRALAGPLCSIIDVTEPFFVNADWILCLEVGEHIPADLEGYFLSNLSGSNKSGMVLSWAIRGQGGDGHVNCQDNEEIIAKVVSMGYTYDHEATEELRSQCATYPDTGWWFRQTLMVFRKN